MGFWDGVASLGLAGRGYEEMDRTLAENAARERQAKLQERAVEEAIRKDDLARSARDAMARIGNRPQAMGLDVTTITPPDESDRWGETKIETTPGFGAPESVDLAGKNRALAEAMAAGGDLEAAEKARKRLKELEAEGYQTMIVGMADGKDPKEIAAEFNSIGQKRIVGGVTDGKTYRFKYEDGTEGVYDRDRVRTAAEARGFLKKPPTTTVPQGSTVVDSTGKPLYTNPKPASTRIDPLSPEGLAARQQFEDYKMRIKANQGGDPAKVREIRWLAEQFDGDTDRAIEVAYGIDKTSKSMEERVQKWASVLKSDFDLAQDSNKLMARARELANSFSVAGGDRRAPRRAAPPPSDRPAPPQPGPTSEGPPPEYPDAVKAPDGKWYVKRGNKWARVEVE